MMKSTTLAEAFPAGEVLADELEARDWTQSEFAEILGRPVQFVSEIVNGKKEITRESAAQIGAALETSPEFWLNLQDSYYLWRQKQDVSTQADLVDVRLRALLRERVPLSLLVQRGFVDKTDVRQQERQILSLYGISELSEKSGFALAARRANVQEELSEVQTAWLMCVRKLADQVQVEEYRASAFVALAERLPRVITDAESFLHLPEMFAEVGVHLVYVEAFPSSKIDGCSFLLHKNPVIGISGRGKRLDKVLFTLLHEMAHIALGHVTSSPILDDSDSPVTLGDETEADRQAGSWIFPQGLPESPARISASWIAGIAQQAGVHPIVVIGRLQKDAALSWRTALVKDAPTVSEALSKW